MHHLCVCNDGLRRAFHHQLARQVFVVITLHHDVDVKVGVVVLGQVDVDGVHHLRGPLVRAGQGVAPEPDRGLRGPHADPGNVRKNIF